MADNLKLEVGEMLISQKITVLDQTSGTENSGSFVMDMETFCNGSSKEATTPNSRIRLQRNLSRKWSPREKKMSSDSIVASISSPRGACSATASPDSAAAPATEAASGQVHQITINASNCNDGRALIKRGSFRRSSTWGLDPRRIAIFSASLSSIGTVLLIYFTLSMCYKADETSLKSEWQQ